jgi:hypothetical protein
MILPDLLFSCGAWSHFRGGGNEEHMALRRVFGPEWKEVTEGWRKLHKIFTNWSTCRIQSDNKTMDG